MPGWQCQGMPCPPKPPWPSYPWQGHPAGWSGTNPGDTRLVSLLLPVPIIPQQALIFAPQSVPSTSRATNSALELGTWYPGPWGHGDTEQVAPGSLLMLCPPSQLLSISLNVCESCRNTKMLLRLRCVPISPQALAPRPCFLQPQQLLPNHVFWAVMLWQAGAQHFESRCRASVCERQDGDRTGTAWGQMEVNTQQLQRCKPRGNGQPGVSSL